MSLRAVGSIGLPGGPGKGFDHADTVTAPEGDRIYVAHTAMDAVDVIDCRTNTYLRTIGDLPGVAGVLVDNPHDLIATSDRSAARVSLFRASDEQLIARVGVGPRPNGLAYDARRRRVFAFNLGEPPGTDCSASVVDVATAAVVRTIPLPGRPRWAIYDAASDSVYANIQEPAVVLRIDAASLEERGRIEVGCAGPHGLALVDGRLFCAADGGEVVVIDDPAGRPTVATRLPLRGVPDVVWHAAVAPLLYVAIGAPGVVTVIDTARLEEVETVETEAGAHTLGWDAVTRRLYVFAPATGRALVFEERS
ncbi:MAG TPA: hypothetical protein VEU77_00990 [Candidatus Acidoferrales bacterium]|nr:hypothetical protein [Candidatus Acidoferrales bacterium]